jgi:hypothetical protein
MVIWTLEEKKARKEQRECACGRREAGSMVTGDLIEKRSLSIEWDSYPADCRESTQGTPAMLTGRGQVGRVD